MDSFNTAFTDTMSLQKAKAEFRTLKMERGELDMYIAKFERLARMAGYNLQDQMVLDRFGSGLNPGLFTTIINNTDPRNWLDWTRTAQKYQQTYLLICSALGLKTGNPTQKPRKKPQTQNNGKWHGLAEKSTILMPWIPCPAAQGRGGLMQMNAQSS